MVRAVSNVQIQFARNALKTITPLVRSVRQSVQLVLLLLLARPVLAMAIHYGIKVHVWPFALTDS